MRLDITNWKPFKIGRLFSMLNGKGITQEEIADNQGDFIAVQSGEDNNGVMGKIDLKYCKEMKYTYSEKPCLTVARSGSAGFVSYQNNGCVVGDSAKILLLSDDVASEEHYLFLQVMLTANKFKYTYGRKVTEDKYLNDFVDLPIQHNADGSLVSDTTYRWSDDGYIPDWKFMEDYIKSLHHEPLTTKNKPGQMTELNVQDWKEFKVGVLFDRLESGLVNDTSKLDEGDEIPYIGAKWDDNGVMFHCTYNSTFVQAGNCVLFICDGQGSVGYANYMDSEFIATVNVVAGYLDVMTPAIGLFLATVISLERPKYSFGRKWKTHLRDTEVKLPVRYDVDGSLMIDTTYRWSNDGYVPDWEFMENYIKSLPYGDRLEG